MKLWESMDTKYSIHAVPMFGEYRLSVENVDLGWVDWPMRFRGRIYYDTPERFPVYVKKRVAAVMKALEIGS